MSTALSIIWWFFQGCFVIFGIVIVSAFWLLITLLIFSVLSPLLRKIRGRS